jgi:hypothetical protein
VDTLDHKVPVDTLDIKEPPVMARRVRKDLKVLREIVVWMDLKDFKDFKELRVPRMGHKVIKDHRDHKVLMVPMVRGVHRVIRDRWVSADIKARKEHKEKKEFEDLVVSKDFKEIAV